MEKAVKTGIIIPRDYGIVIKKKEGRHFISPLKYAIAKLMLENKQEINERLKRFAEVNNYNLSDVKSDFKNAVKKKEKKEIILTASDREILFDVKNYGLNYTAKVQSKSNNLGIYHEVSVSPSRLNQYNELIIGEVACLNCPDTFWTKIKGRTLNCVHTSTLETALYLDNASKHSIKNNITGLKPSERPVKMILPFTLTTDSKLDDLLTEILWEYYVEDRNQFGINRSLLDDNKIYSEGLVNLLNNNYDKAEFAVIRQEEKEKLKITESEKRLYGASKMLEKRLKEKLNEKGFNFQGYELEFKNTKDEMIAQRYRNANEVYSICIADNYLPFVIRKFLGSKREFLSKPEYRPLKLTDEKYISLDDSSRRDALTQIIIPGERENSDMFVPEILKEAYLKMKINNS